MHNNGSDVVAVAMLFVVLLAMGAFLGWGCTQAYLHEEWQREAVKHGAAEYDQETGRWRWKDDIGKH